MEERNPHPTTAAVWWNKSCQKCACHNTNSVALEPPWPYWCSLFPLAIFVWSCAHATSMSSWVRDYIWQKGYDHCVEIKSHMKVFVAFRYERCCEGYGQSWSVHRSQSLLCSWGIGCLKTCQFIMFITNQTPQQQISVLYTLRKKYVL